MGLVSKNYDRLTKTEKKIADIIINKPHKVLEMSISELAMQANVKSEASIVKFYKKLGLSGFQQMKVLLAQELIQDSMELVYEDVEESDPAEVVAEKIFKATIKALFDTLSTLDIHSLEKAVEFFDKAKLIVFFGTGGSGAVAADAFHKFIRIGKNCQYKSDEHIMATILCNLTPNDLLVLISHSGETKTVVMFAEKAVSKGIPVIALTGNKHSSLAKKATLVLATNTRETRFRTDAMTSRLVQLVIFDTIYTLLAARNPEKVIEHLNKTRVAVSEFKF
jgi:DNA-binding MurR/RpiR family transcriptional regulator